MGTAGATLSPGDDEQLSVRAGHCQVVVDDWDCDSEVIDEALALRAMCDVRELNAGKKLCDGDRGHRYFVIVVYHLVEP